MSGKSAAHAPLTCSGNEHNTVRSPDGDQHKTVFAAETLNLTTFTCIICIGLYNYLSRFRKKIYLRLPVNETYSQLTLRLVLLRFRYFRILFSGIVL